MTQFILEIHPLSAVRDSPPDFLPPRLAVPSLPSSWASVLTSAHGSPPFSRFKSMFSFAGPL